jgi:hypothetical protein
VGEAGVLEFTILIRLVTEKFPTKCEKSFQEVKNIQLLMGDGQKPIPIRY